MKSGNSMWNNELKFVSKTAFWRFLRAAVGIALFFAFFFLPAFSGPRDVYANSPVPQYDFSVTVKNAPEGAYGVDFLIPKECIPEEEYTDYNEAIAESGFSRDSGIVQYAEDGYVSFMAHCRPCWFDGELHEWNGDLEAYGMTSGYDIISGQPDVKLAVFDREGKVLAVSESFKAHRSTPRHYYGNITFDIGNAALETNGPGPLSGSIEADIPDPETDGFADRVIETILAAFFLLVIAVITMVLELLVALLFRLKPVWWVLAVNLCSNLVFNVLLVFFCYLKYPPVPYLRFVLTGEAVVVLAEFLAYTKLYENYGKLRLFFYTLVANVFSAVLVLLFTAASRG